MMREPTTTEKYGVKLTGAVVFSIVVLGECGKYIFCKTKDMVFYLSGFERRVIHNVCPRG
jgi:hypothetical protein